MGDRKGDWSQTFTGLQFWPLDPRPEDVRAEDIAHALSLQCRFAGHCREFYSVAEHSVLVSEWIWDETNGDRIASLAGLLHDASEAYCVDVPRPLKPFLTGYREIEHGVMRAVETWAGLPIGACEAPIVKRADEALLMTEARDLMAPAPVPWTFSRGAHAKPLRDAIVPWDWRHAERMFLERLAALGGVRRVG